MQKYAQSLGNRRLRGNHHIRELVAQTHVSVKEMIQPLFVVEGIAEREAIPGLTGTYRDTPKTLLKQVEADLKAGVEKFLFFAIPANDKKSLHDFDHTFLQSQIRALKKQFGDAIWLACDVCLCSSTNHGHCGVLNDVMDHVLNPDSTRALAQMALACAQAGADCVAPSDMMDGRVRAIRDILDDHDLSQTVLMSYSAKFGGAFYGPFRVACDSAPDKKMKLQDRKTYQLSYRRADDAFICSHRDAEEGADILMVKPIIHYLDIARELTSEIRLPFAAYYVSGEHAMVESSAAAGLINGPAAHVEAWHAIKRAGVTIIITYGARYAREWLEEYAA